MSYHESFRFLTSASRRWHLDASLAVVDGILACQESTQHRRL